MSEIKDYGEPLRAPEGTSHIVDRHGSVIGGVNRQRGRTRLIECVNAMGGLNPSALAPFIFLVEASLRACQFCKPVSIVPAKCCCEPLRTALKELRGENNG